MKFKKYLAGHEFADDKIDSNCILQKKDGVPCTATRAFLFETTESDVGKHDIAHTLYLNASEYASIRDEREAYKAHCEKVMDAIRYVCAG